MLKFEPFEIEQSDPNPTRHRYFTRHAQPLPSTRKREQLMAMQAELQPAVRLAWRYLQRKRTVGGGVEAWAIEREPIRQMLRSSWEREALTLKTGERAAKLVWRVWHYEAPWHEETSPVPHCPLILPHGSFKLAPAKKATSDMWWLTVAGLNVPMVIDAGTRRQIERGDAEVREVVVLEKTLTERQCKRFRTKYRRRGNSALVGDKLLVFALVLRAKEEAPVPVTGGPSDDKECRSYYDAQHDALKDRTEEGRARYVAMWATMRDQWKARILARRAKALFPCGQRWLLQKTAPDVLAHRVSAFLTAPPSYAQTMALDSL